ncbi:MAG: tetratricopeptide repeat protein [Acidobacteriota bacterium]
MRQTARQLLNLMFVAIVLAMVVRPAAAMGPMAGTESVPGMGPAVSPESCLACTRAFDPMACHRTALSLAAGREWERAIAVEEAVHRALPGNAEVAAVLARMYQEGTRNTPRAVELYHEALAAWPGYPLALLGLGIMMEKSGDLNVAARYFERGARERPDEPQFKVRLASALVQAGREEQARPILNEIVQRWPDSREAEAARKMMPITALAKP